MKLSQGGVMLMVRLQAALQAESSASVARFANLTQLGDPRSLFPPQSRLLLTYDWLNRQFGQTNANRALIETAREILSA